MTSRGARHSLRRRKLALGLATALLCLGILSARALWEGRDALGRGDSALKAGDTEAALRWWRRAARWYLPLAPHVGKAYDKLQRLAEESESRGETELAIAAWTGIRSSVRATRSFYTPYAERMETADSHLAQLMARREQLDDPSIDVASRKAWHQALLERDPMPSIGWSIVALLGLALWIGGGFAFAITGINASDRLVPKAAAYSGAAVSVGLLVWLTGLYLA